MEASERSKFVIGGNIILQGFSCSLVIEQDDDVVAIARHEVDELIAALQTLKAEMV